ncbi:MAG: class I SAM-dependent methyltransferase [Coriobacteriia bacterium]|nr:class I SAM-dependent methyltransferase [Coriobacteriia bacterium]
MAHEKFNPAHLDRLNDPGRLLDMPPDAMWAALGNPSPKVIVDIGAGTAVFSCQFAERAPEAIVYAVDTEPTMVRWMIENRPPAVCERVRPLLSSERAVPLPTGESDLTVMINLHHELVEPIETYREALRLTRIGGQLLVVDWHPDALDKGPSVDIRVSPEQIAETARAVGFTETVIHPQLMRHSLVTARKPAVCGL